MLPVAVHLGLHKRGCHVRAKSMINKRQANFMEKVMIKKLPTNFGRLRGGEDLKKISVTSVLTARFLFSLALFPRRRPTLNNGETIFRYLKNISTDM